METMQEFLQQLDYTRHMIKHKRIHKHNGLPWSNPTSNRKQKMGGMLQRHPSQTTHTPRELALALGPLHKLLTSYSHSQTLKK